MYFRTLFAALLALALQARPAIQETTVPFVGCKSDGQVGPLPAPTAPNRVVRVDANIADRLSYYKAENGPGVLGPRGWNCLGIYGSGGSILFVAPSPLSTDSLFSLTPGIAGPAIQLDESNGDTSGKYEVAQVAARVFPAYKDFALRVMADIAPASFPFGPYPGDRLVYRNDRTVEYETLSSRGLGTMSRLQQNNEPIRGVAILKGTEVSLWLLSMRLPSNMADLTTNIIQHLEQEP